MSFGTLFRAKPPTGFAEFDKVGDLLVLDSFVLNFHVLVSAIIAIIQVSASASFLGNTTLGKYQGDVPELRKPSYFLSLFRGLGPFLLSSPLTFVLVIFVIFLIMHESRKTRAIEFIPVISRQS